MVFVPPIFYGQKGGLMANKPEHQINDDIRDKEVRVIGPDGTMLGIMSAQEANRRATKKD